MIVWVSVQAWADRLTDIWEACIYMGAGIYNRSVYQVVCGQADCRLHIADYRLQIAYCSLYSSQVSSQHFSQVSSQHLAAARLPTISAIRPGNLRFQNRRTVNLFKVWWPWQTRNHRETRILACIIPEAYRRQARYLTS